MPTPASLTLQQAIYTTLSAAADLTTILGGAKIFDHLPEETPFPYVTLGPFVMSDWSTSSELGREHQLQIHVWSRDTGSTQAQQISEAIITALHDVALNLQDNVLINLRFVRADALRDPDGKTHHSILRFRAVTEQS